MAWSLNANPEISFVDFGAYDSQLIQFPTVSHAINKQYASWWSLNLTGCDYGDESIFGTDTSIAIIDTGTSFLTLS
jgi:hypothetical protein